MISNSTFYKEFRYDVIWQDDMKNKRWFYTKALLSRSFMIPSSRTDCMCSIDDNGACGMRRFYSLQYSISTNRMGTVEYENTIVLCPNLLKKRYESFQITFEGSAGRCSGAAWDLIVTCCHSPSQPTAHHSCRGCFWALNLKPSQREWQTS